MSITPETKSWTWVLERPCPECGFDAAAVDPATVGSQLRAVASSFASLLTSASSEWLRARPNEQTWSPTEYACHVRDVFRVFDGRLALMLSADDVTFANWDQDATAIEDDYAAASPSVVAAELLALVSPLADRLDGVRGADWERTALRSDGAVFTTGTLARYLLHDPVHHLWDVRG